MKFCKDCKYEIFKVTAADCSACTAKGEYYNPVTGDPPSCATMRKDKDACGYWAEWFEPKEQDNAEG